jgi:HicB family
MSTLSLRLPESIHRSLKTMAEREGISINQRINSAVAEKWLAALPGNVRGARWRVRARGHGRGHRHQHPAAAVSRDAAC